MRVDLLSATDEVNLRIKYYFGPLRFLKKSFLNFVKSIFFNNNLKTKLG